MARGLQVAARSTRDLLWPPTCLVCRRRLDRSDALCPPCWSKLSFIDGAVCARCGVPFEVDPGLGAVCGRCAARPPVYAAGRTALRYDDGCRRLLLAFKHGDRLDVAPALARWMVRAGGPILADADLIVPVPLHRWRLFARRYNQAALLALAIGRETGVAVAVAALHRHRRTPSQKGKSASARRRNVAGAFKVPLPAMVIGRRIVLVDDVMTTGATLDACARTLLTAGAADVRALTLARVVHAQ